MCSCLACNNYVEINNHSDTQKLMSCIIILGISHVCVHVLQFLFEKGHLIFFLRSSVKGLSSERASSFSSPSEGAT